MFQKDSDTTLVLILTESLELHTKLLELLKAEREVLIKNPGELPAITSKKQDLLVQLEEKERLRRLALVNVAGEYTIKLKDATLARLAEASGNPQYQILRTGFKSVLVAIRDHQARNNALIQQGLSMANDLVDVLFAEEEGPLYGPGGGTEDSKTANKYVDGHI